MYEVHISEATCKFLNKLDKQIKERIEERLKKLRETPVPSDAKFIRRDEKNNKISRYRVGNFRALYKIKDADKIVLVAKIDKRPKVYDKKFY